MKPTHAVVDVFDGNIEHALKRLKRVSTNAAFAGS